MNSPFFLRRQVQAKMKIIRIAILLTLILIGCAGLWIWLPYLGPYIDLCLIGIY